MASFWAHHDRHSKKPIRSPPASPARHPNQETTQEWELSPKPTRRKQQAWDGSHHKESTDEWELSPEKGFHHGHHVPDRDVTRESARSPVKDGLRLAGLRLKKVPGKNIFHESAQDKDGGGGQGDHHHVEGLKVYKNTSHLVTSESTDEYGFEGGLRIVGDRNAVVESNNPHGFPRGFKKKHFDFHGKSPHIEGASATVVDPMAGKGTQRSHESSKAHSGHVTAGPAGLMPAAGYEGCGILPGNRIRTTSKDGGFGDVTGSPEKQRRAAPPVSENADEQALHRGPKTSEDWNPDHVGGLGIASSGAVPAAAADLGNYDTAAAAAATNEASGTYAAIRARARGGAFNNGAFLAADS